MAQPNYNEGVASVAPETSAPSDYQNIQATPASFGAEIAQGGQQLGAGATKAAAFYNQSAADDASNNFQDFATKLLHGDPSKTVTGPDGQPTPDTGYLGLRGRAALDARPGVSDQLDSKLKELRGQLSSPEAQLQFDNFSRRYRSMVDERVGSHADGQATTWYHGVNTSSAKLAMDHIANNFDQPNEVAAGAADLTAAYVRNAQLNGATPDSPQMKEAFDSARRDALAAQLNAMAVKDPARALAVLDKNKDIAGVQYDNLANSFRGRAKQQQGYDVGDQAIKGTYTNMPAPNPVVLTNAGAQYGISGAYLQRVHEIEGNGTSSTGAQGPFQFIPLTAARYGLKNPFDYQASAEAAAHLAADNRVSLTAALGRPPSDAELYLAHQQGADGAAKLLAHPNVRAGDLVGDRAIRVNGGNPDAPASSFTGMWTSKFNMAPLQATANRKAAAFQTVLSIPEDQIDPDVRQHALTRVSQTLNAQSIAEEADAKAKKDANDQMSSGIASDIVNGKTDGIIGRIASSGLPANEIENLYNFATIHGGVSDPLQYGPSYTDALKRVLAPPNDPSRINDPAEIIRMGADGTLTKKGVQELLTTQNLIKKQPDQAGINTVKSSQLQYYKSKMAIDDEMSAITGKPFKNQKGLDRFNHDFVPAFESAYSQWVAKGNDPMEFLNDPKKMDAIMDRVYPPAERAKDAISATGGAKPDMTIPPAPAGVNKDTFQSIVKNPPVGVDGTQWTPTAFATAIDRLRSNPTPETKAAFNRWFGKAGFDADEILHKLPAKLEKHAEADEPVPLTGTAPENPAMQKTPVSLGFRG